MTGQSWLEDSEVPCQSAEYDGLDWAPSGIHGGLGSVTRRRTRRMRVRVAGLLSLCNACPLAGACLNQGLIERDQWTVRGNTIPPERKSALLVEQVQVEQLQRQVVWPRCAPPQRGMAYWVDPTTDIPSQFAGGVLRYAPATSENPDGRFLSFGGEVHRFTAYPVPQGGWTFHRGAHRGNLSHMFVPYYYEAWECH